jgi:hypothetical protein
LGKTTEWISSGCAVVAIAVSVLTGLYSCEQVDEANRIATGANDIAKASQDTANKGL